VLARFLVFGAEQGRAVDQAEFGRGFQGVLRVLKIGPRPFYNTRHTYISVALTLGCNIKWIAEQCGTSVEMIQENYGKYIRSDGDAPILDYLSRAEDAQQEGENKDKSETVGETFSNERASCAGFMVVPTGFEPVLPT
jgi:hypothetical protein